MSRVNAFFPRELMHVDDAGDEERDKAKMAKMEEQEETLRKMHLGHLLAREQLMNKIR